MTVNDVFETVSNVGSPQRSALTTLSFLSTPGPAMVCELRNLEFIYVMRAGLIDL